MSVASGVTSKDQVVNQKAASLNFTSVIQPQVSLSSLQCVS